MNKQELIIDILEWFEHMERAYGEPIEFITYHNNYEDDAQLEVPFSIYEEAVDKFENESLTLFK